MADAQDLMRRRLEEHSTERLVELVGARDPNEYRPEAYQLMEEILAERGEPVPEAPAESTELSLVRCPYCREEILEGAVRCKHCGSDLAKSEKSNAVAAFLGLLLGPVGLWYKGQWAAGFAWLIGTVVAVIASAGWLAPVCWIGMAVHAGTADTK